MGPITQIPPMHSALKKDGKALYEYARNGETVEREPRHVVIHELELLDLQLDGDAPFLSLHVQCSKGTYIRTLGEDIGEALGCGGHLTRLRRVQTGPFDASQCITVEALEALDEAAAARTPVAGECPAARTHARHARRRQCRSIPQRPAAPGRLARPGASGHLRPGRRTRIDTGPAGQWPHQGW